MSHRTNIVNESDPLKLIDVWMGERSELLGEHTIDFAKLSKYVNFMMMQKSTKDGSSTYIKSNMRKCTKEDADKNGLELSEKKL